MTDLPPDFSWKYHKTSRTRGSWVVTAPNGTRVSFYDDGGMRVYRPDHHADVALADRKESGTSVNIEFIPRP